VEPKTAGVANNHANGVAVGNQHRNKATADVSR
jgi:hypothetical protein